MDTTDGRKLSEAVLNDRRRRAVKMRLGGATITETAKLCEIGERTVWAATKAYERGGWSAVIVQHGHRPRGTGRLLTLEQEREVQRLIRDHVPDQLKMSYALWTRQAVRELILHRYDVLLCVRAVGNYLKRWGFTPQKPLKKAYEQSPQAVGKWLDEQYPEIAKRAKQVGAEIHWGDETGLRSDDVRGRGYAPKGETAVLRARPGKEGEDGARSAEVAAKIEMVGCGGVEVYCSLGQTLTKHLGIELQITLRIGSNRSDVKQTDYRIHTDLSWVKRNHEQFCSSVVLAGTGQRGSRGKQV